MGGDSLISMVLGRSGRSFCFSLLSFVVLDGFVIRSALREAFFFKTKIPCRIRMDVLLSAGSTGHGSAYMSPRK